MTTMLAFGVVIGLTCLAFIVPKRTSFDSAVCYIIAFPALLAFSFYLYITYASAVILICSIAIAGLSFFSLYKAIESLIRG